MVKQSIPLPVLNVSGENFQYNGGLYYQPYVRMKSVLEDDLDDPQSALLKLWSKFKHAFEIKKNIDLAGLGLSGENIVPFKMEGVGAPTKHPTNSFKGYTGSFDPEEDYYIGSAAKQSAAVAAGKNLTFLEAGAATEELIHEARFLGGITNVMDTGELLDIIQAIQKFITVVDSSIAENPSNILDPNNPFTEFFQIFFSPVRTKDGVATPGFIRESTDTSRQVFEGIVSSYKFHNTGKLLGWYSGGVFAGWLSHLDNGATLPWWLNGQYYWQSMPYGENTEELMSGWYNRGVTTIETVAAPDYNDLSVIGSFYWAKSIRSIDNGPNKWLNKSNDEDSELWTTKYESGPQHDAGRSATFLRKVGTFAKGIGFEAVAGEETSNAEVRAAWDQWVIDTHPSNMPASDAYAPVWDAWNELLSSEPDVAGTYTFKYSSIFLGYMRDIILDSPYNLWFDFTLGMRLNLAIPTPPEENNEAFNEALANIEAAYLSSDLVTKDKYARDKSFLLGGQHSTPTIGARWLSLPIDNVEFSANDYWDDHYNGTITNNKDHPWGLMFSPDGDTGITPTLPDLQSTMPNGDTIPTFVPWYPQFGTPESVHSLDKRPTLWAASALLNRNFANEISREKILGLLKVKLSQKAMGAPGTEHEGKENKLLNELFPLKELVVSTVFIYRYFMGYTYPELDYLFGATKSTINSLVTQAIAAGTGDYQYVDPLTLDMDPATKVSNTSPGSGAIAKQFMMLVVQMAANMVDPTWKTPWLFPGPLTPVGVLAKVLSKKNKSKSKAEEDAKSKSIGDKPSCEDLKEEESS